MPKIELTSPTGEIRVVEVSELPSESELQEISNQIFGTTPPSGGPPLSLGGDAPLGGSKSTPGGLLTNLLNRSPEEFTTAERITTQTGIPMAAGISGSLAGAKAGAAIGTAIAPGVGTAIGGGIGLVAGGALATGAGQALADVMEPILGGKKRTKEEIQERALAEAKTSAKIDVAFLGAGGVLKGVARPALRAVSKDVRALKAMEKVSKKAAIEQKKLQVKLSQIKSAAKDASISIKGALKTRKEFSEAISDKALSKLSQFSDKEVTKLSKELAQSSNKALRAVGQEYDKVEKAFGKSPINIIDQVTQLENLSKATDPLTFQSMTPISNISSKIAAKGADLNVKDAVTLRRALSNQVRKLYNRGGEASGALAENLDDILRSIDGQLDTATNGVTSELNRTYRETANLAKANKLFRDELTRAGNAGLQNAEDIVKADLNSLLKDAEKAGSEFFRIPKKEALEAARRGENIFNVSNKSVLKLTNQSKILRNTNIPEMKALADSMDESLVKLARAQASKKSIKDNLKNIGLKEPVATDLSRKIEKEIISNKESQVLFKEGLANLAEKTKISEDVLSNYISGNSLKNISETPASGVIIKSAVGLASLRKYSPLLANTIDEFMQPAIDFTLKANAKNEFVKQSVQEINSVLFQQ